MNILTVQQVKNLNELEMEVYQYVMQHKNTVPYMRIRELAMEAHVSTTTVLHFCKKMGCDGYTEFKQKLKKFSGQKEAVWVPEDIEEIKSFFQQLEENKYEQQLEKAAALIAKAEKVVMVGIGNSGSIGEYAARYFTNMGKFSLFITDPFYPMNLPDAVSTVVIVLSVSGETEHIIDIINKLRQTKSSIIAIVGNKKSSVAKLADIVLAYNITVRRGEQKIDFSTQIPAVYLLEMLAKKVHNRLTE